MTLRTDHTARFVLSLILVGTMLGGCKSSESGDASLAPPTGGGTNPPSTTNTPPTLTSPGSQSGETGSSVNLTLSASDADGDALTFSASGLPAGLTIDMGSGIITGTLAVAGSNNVTVTASDGEASDSKSFSWTVTMPGGPSNSPPVLGNPGNQTSEVGATVNVALTANDADGDTLIFSASGLPAGLAIGTSSGVITGTPTTAGSRNVTVSVSDGNDGDSVSFTWTVSNPAPPAVGSVTLQWTPPTQNDDGSPLLDLAGYKIYFGTEPGGYGPPITIDNPGISTYVVEDLPLGTYYFVATAVNSSGIESNFSNVAIRTVN